MRSLLTKMGLTLSAVLLAGQVAAACDETILLEYKVSDGRYQFELNDVYLDSGAAQSTSGGIPIEDWLLAGENTIRVSMDAANGEFSVYAICNDGSGRRDFDAVSLTGKKAATLVFPVSAPSPRVYLTAEPVPVDGLFDAVDALQAAMSSHDFDAVWDYHAAMRAELELSGRTTKAEAYQMGKIVEAIEPELAPNLQARPVLGGRVWEVFGDGFAPPISAVVSANGGQVRFKTGSFWMKTGGSWSVYRK